MNSIRCSITIIAIFIVLNMDIFSANPNMAIGAEPQFVKIQFAREVTGTKLHIYPPTIEINKGTIVVWMNEVPQQEVRVLFQEGKNCMHSTMNPTKFNLDSTNCYASNFMTYYETSQLQFTQPGTFKYIVQTKDFQFNAEGVVIVPQTFQEVDGIDRDYQALIDKMVLLCNQNPNVHIDQTEFRKFLESEERRTEYRIFSSSLQEACRNGCPESYRRGRYFEYVQKQYADYQTHINKKTWEKQQEQERMKADKESEEQRLLAAKKQEEARIRAAKEAEEAKRAAEERKRKEAEECRIKAEEERIRAAKEAEREAKYGKLVTTEKLYREYRDDTIRAEQMYTNKPIRLIGRVSEVGKTKQGDTYVMFCGNVSGSCYWDFSIVCFFQNEEKELIRTLNLVKEVELVGKCLGKFSNVHLEECKILE